MMRSVGTGATWIAAVAAAALGWSSLASAQPPSSPGSPAGAATAEGVRSLIAAAREENQHLESDKDYVLAGQALAAARRLDPSTLLEVIDELGDLLFLTGRSDDLERILLDMLASVGPGDAQTLDRLRRLGRYYYRIADYGEAERYMLQAVELAERRAGPADPQSIAARGELARLYMEAVRAADADIFVQDHLRRSREVLGPAHAVTLRAQADYAVLLEALNRSAESEALLESTVAALKAAPEIDSGELIRTAALLAMRVMETDDYGRAQSILAGVEPHLAGLPKGHSSRLLPALPAALLDTRTLGKQVAAARLAAVIDDDSRGFTHPEVMAGRALLARLLLSEPSMAADAFEPARRAVEGFVERNDRAYRRARRQTSSFADAQLAREIAPRGDFYAVLAEAAWHAQSQPDQDRDFVGSQAFDAIQNVETNIANRAMVAMAARRLAERRGPQLGILVRERQELEQLFAANSFDRVVELAESPEGARGPAGGTREAERIERRISEIDAIIRRDFPEYFYLSQPGGLSILDVSDLLAPDELILLLVPTEFSTHVVAVGKDAFVWARSDLKTADIDHAVRRLLYDLGATVTVSPAEEAEWRAANPEGSHFDRATAYRLYRDLIEPVAHVLNGKRHLFAYATGPLSGLPLGILVTEPPQGLDADPAALRGTAWFADKIAMSSVPSLQAFHLLRQPEPERSKEQKSGGFIGFGDPLLLGEAVARGRNRAGPVISGRYFSERRSSTGTPLANVAELRGMSRLPGTATELEQMRAALGAPSEAVRLREQATERNVKATDFGSVRVITFATHGLVAGEISTANEPGLVLTPPAEGSEEDDGFLAASEVAALRLAAEWVILSACNTAASDGAGLSGLARAFFYAGAQALLATHWPVRDEVAAVLTARTVELAQTADISRAEAFQQAMREIRLETKHDGRGDTWAHPNAWAPFSLYGDGAK